LSTITFKEGDSFVVFCPELELTGYGVNPDDAKESFDSSLAIYLEYALDHKTLTEDLLNHGWTLSRFPRISYIPPNAEENRKKIKKLLGVRPFQEKQELIVLPV
jgi:hypothetical protein